MKKVSNGLLYVLKLFYHFYGLLCIFMHFKAIIKLIVSVVSNYIHRYKILFWKNLLTKNSPGSRYQILLSTFRFIITFFKTNLIYTEQSITHTLKVKLKRKKKAHQGNHFSPTIHNYIVAITLF